MRSLRNLMGNHIVSGAAELLDRIEPLWHELRSHRAAHSEVWRDSILRANWFERRAGLLEKSKDGRLLVLIASRDDGYEPIAYCVCTITAAGLADNAAAARFYEQFGFHPRTITMRHRP